MSKINKTFTSGEKLTASDLNSIVSAHNALEQDIINKENFYFMQKLSFEVISGGNIVIGVNDTNYMETFRYSKDNGNTWNIINTYTEIEYEDPNCNIYTFYIYSLSVSTGDIVIFKKNGDTPIHFSCTNNVIVNVFGNIMSLIYGDNFIENTSLIQHNNSFGNSDEGIFSELFRFPTAHVNNYVEGFGNILSKSLNIFSSKNLILPATTLTADCYCAMFKGCTLMVDTPELPATILANSCYSNMFAGCISLKIAPKLPATTLVRACYWCMFSGCTSLTESPILSATILGESCYLEMFYNCSNLSKVICLLEDVTMNNTISSPTKDWLKNVSSNGIFFKNSQTNLLSSNVSGIPDGWTTINL